MYRKTFKPLRTEKFPENINGNIINGLSAQSYEEWLKVHFTGEFMRKPQAIYCEWENLSYPELQGLNHREFLSGIVWSLKSKSD